MTRSPKLSPFLLPALFFFISGFCGLVYQIVWMRLAFASFGITTGVLSVVLSVFMAGLGLGSWAAGQWIRGSKASRFSFLRAYGLAEGLIGIGAFLVSPLYSLGSRLLLPSGTTDSALYLFLSALAILFSLLPWCFCMGATFPLMMAYLKERTSAEKNFSFLYVANSLGAMTGALLTVVVLIELLGFHHTLLFAGCLNLSLCAASWYWAGLSKPFSSLPITSSEDPVPEALSPFSIAILFTTGFISMAMEVAWTRNFTPVLGNQVYAFAFILVAYLLATSVGAWVYRCSSRRAFSLPLLLALLFISALLTIGINDPRLQSNPLILLASILPFCGLLGFLTPALVDRYSQGDPTLAGKAYAVNIIGCVLGPLFCSYFFLPLLGTRLSLLLFALPLAYFAVKTFDRRADKVRLMGGLLGLGALLTGVVLLWSVDFEESYATFLTPSVMRRDPTATVVTCGTGMRRSILVNGIGMTSLVPETKVMGHLPLAYLSHPPRSALNICFGMGTTFRSLCSWGIQTTVVDLVPSVVRSFGYFWADADKVAADPSHRIVVDDGRRYLLRTDELYDVITLDPPPPMEAAGSSLLYSVEFYDQVKKHLKKGGILQQWIPDTNFVTTQSAVESLSISFPYIRAFRSARRMGTHFLASMTPLAHRTTRDLVENTPPAARKDLVEFFVDKNPTVVYDDLVKNEFSLDIYRQGSLPPLLTDDRPFNEYYLCRKFVPLLQSLLNRPQ